MRECVDALVGDLAPHQEGIRVPLTNQLFGEGAENVRAGNRAARRGDWSIALTHYHAAIQTAPESDVAWYAFGLAQEATGELGEALAAYRTAERLDQQDRYGRAALRVEESLPRIALARRQKMQISIAQFSPPSDRGDPLDRAHSPNFDIRRLPPHTDLIVEQDVLPPNDRSNWITMQPMDVRLDGMGWTTLDATTSHWIATEVVSDHSTATPDNAFRTW
jgi:hypothetical protein